MSKDVDSEPPQPPLDVPISPKPEPIPVWANFLIGGTAGILSRIVVQPADLVKTRMQLLKPKDAKTKSALTMTKDIIAKNGVLGLYTGISAALFRQGTYTTARFGIYNILFESYKDKYGQPRFGTKLMIGLIAGGCSACIGNPGEVVLIRMTADGHLPPEKRRNYTHVFNALARVIREEGVATLWRGTVTTVTRAMVVNAAQLGTYSQAKEMLMPSLGDTMFLYFCSSMISGVITVFISLPLDIVKTRIQNKKRSVGQVEVFMKIIKHEGPLSLWNGFLPSFIKIAPQTILIFIFFEQLLGLYRRMNPPCESPKK